MARYVCPKDQDIVLFEDEDDPDNDGGVQVLNESVLEERPKLCSKCGEYYFKGECHKIR